MHAFEINPVSINELRKNVALNRISNLKIVCATAWVVDGLVLNFNNIKENDRSTNSVR